LFSTSVTHNYIRQVWFTWLWFLFLYARLGFFVDYWFVRIYQHALQAKKQEFADYFSSPKKTQRLGPKSLERERIAAITRT